MAEMERQGILTDLVRDRVLRQFVSDQASAGILPSKTGQAILGNRKAFKLLRQDVYSSGWSPAAEAAAHSAHLAAGGTPKQHPFLSWLKANWKTIYDLIAKLLPLFGVPFTLPPLPPNLPTLPPINPGAPPTGPPSTVVAVPAAQDSGMASRMPTAFSLFGVDLSTLSLPTLMAHAQALMVEAQALLAKGPQYIAEAQHVLAIVAQAMAVLKGLGVTAP